MCNEIHNSVLLSSFLKGRKKLRIVFHDGAIVWSKEKSPSKQYVLPMENVLTVQHNYLKKRHPSEKRQINPKSFTIHYSEKRPNARWVYKHLNLKHQDPVQASTWVETLKSHLERLKQRPKRLLLFINPRSGKGKALQVYDRHVKQLLAIAEVEVTVVISQRKDQIKDYLTNYNLDMFDSVACVGGDGTFSEIFHGLVLRECRLKGVDPNDISQELPKPKLPVGVIPGGSTDAVAYCVHGTTDPTTAVLQIIFGDHLGLDLVSVYDDQSLLRLYSSVLSFGYLGDILYYSENYQWMGRQRHNFLGFGKLFRNKGYKGEVDFYSESPDVIEVPCRESCEKCELGKKTSNDKANCKWQTITGKFFMFSGANIPCACNRSPKGIAPYCHLGDGSVHLVLVKHTSLLNNIRLLFRMWSVYTTLDDLSFVKTISAREFSFRSLEGKDGRWNCDGEIQKQINVRAKVRCQLLTIFSRGNSNYAPSRSMCCGFF